MLPDTFYRASGSFLIYQVRLTAQGYYDNMFICAFRGVAQFG